MKHPIGIKVKVVKATDDTCNENFIGLNGIVVAHNVNGATGNTLGDPLHVVQFENDSSRADDNTGRRKSVLDRDYGGVNISSKYKRESFWYEELEPVK